MNTAPAWLDWIRPWYPGGEDATAGQFNEPPVFIGHIYPDCDDLLAVESTPREGAGWLDPNKPGTCLTCLNRHNNSDDDEGDTQ
ncbi:hypothetical protein [Nonomuraea sp. SBT364]|uniref:hypothetical protein n=1 Tax=Nonomuraea sp. SBT364 TaxID=1580530 RepID=UPI00066A98EC|nr:hypothetical protein [Nonomuraea sp. SBT364]